MSESPSRSALRRSSRTLVIAAVAVVPTVGIVAAAGASSPVLKSFDTGHHRRITMSYDRADVAALNGRLAAAQRAKMLGWYRALDDSQRKADQARASRGEPRQALGAASASKQYWRPTTGTFTQPFHPGHDGIDLGVPIGTPVLSAADGVVTFAGEQSGYGTHVEVTHADGTVTTYSHLSKVDVTVGQAVKAGQQIAESGNTGHSTGPHLHFEVHPTKDTKTNPLAWLQAHGAW